ncbi:MAG TPA: PmoA family protein [Candidatus Aminicenantes bacterium]|nr:PmoA family protein [Candidatus Aminicenantes bacterium]HRY66205.1 PmoA family protein [Candidatus Aminicenantes bacterium]HRZ73119.1 PmoA family protein [Candidatus Aminicenantes bacterium]
MTAPGRPLKDLPRVWIVVFAVVLASAALLALLSRIARIPASAMSLVEEPGPFDPGKPALPPPPPSPEGLPARAVTVLDGGQRVLTYVYGDKLAPGVDPRYARSGYIHPLYSLDGLVLTEDFPRDHRHHHGLLWAWPEIRVRGVETSNWEPAEPPLRQRFVRWIERQVTNAGARLVVENAWQLGGTGTVAEETVTILVAGATRFGRAIDIEIALRPVGEPIFLKGASEDNKGYGGLCFRGRAIEGFDSRLFKGAAMMTDRGPLTEDSSGGRFRWADLSIPGSGGVAIFVSPRHPGFPPPWLVRNSYAGILNPCWPALEGAVLEAGVPVSLRYRVYIHSGDAGTGRVAEAYAAYLAAEKK